MNCRYLQSSDCEIHKTSLIFPFTNYIFKTLLNQEITIFVKIRVMKLDFEPEPEDGGVMFCLFT